ncbi:MAG: hypothetical protein AAGJ79_12640 [Verrucomicrobiota bacterium]
MTAFDLSTNAKFALTGEDRIRFLNGQVTNDVKSASSALALPACVTNAKGKLDALVQITVSPAADALWLDTHEALRENLFTRLDRYIIADDCELADVTADFHLWHVCGDAPPEVEAAICAKSRRFGVDGWDVWSKNPPAWNAADPALADRLRLENLVPAWNAEATPDYFPADLGLDHTAVDFHKGCYIGQEIISRMKMSGKSNWILASLSLESAPNPGTSVFLEGEAEKEIGKITTVSKSDALAIMRRSKATPGTKILAQDSEKPLSIRGEITKTV